MILGVDTGGTFTDFVLWDGTRLKIHKVLSTPDAPERAILQGIEEMEVVVDGMTIIHGSTVATNAVLEGKGVRTLLITNRGFADLLTIGRQARDELYNLQSVPPAPPVPAEDCLEVDARVAADGAVVKPLTQQDLQQLRREVEASGAEAVAINLLFSFLDGEMEKQIESVIPEGFFISRSSSVLPEYREYERGIATWLNSYVGPLVAGYLQRLEWGVDGANLSVMQSSANTIAAGQAGAEAVKLLLSGPAGGLAAARFMGQQVGRKRLLTFDMGGTSTDVALIDGVVKLTPEGRIGRYPVAVPMVDMHTIGAGGGSIAHLDPGGMLQVGPESAGASPGPACYGRGGTQPTVTDANLLLGRLRMDAFLGGEMVLDIEASRGAMAPLAKAMDCTVEEAAEGVIRVANERMSHALRVISVQRGIDPRGHTLVSFGGAGGLHVCALAESLDMNHAMIPVHGGVLSALGMLVAPRGRELSHSMIGLLDSFDPEGIEYEFEQLERQGRAALVAEGVVLEAIRTDRVVDLRYRGQSYTLGLSWNGDRKRVVEDFHRAHADRYGHCFDFPVELVNLRVAVREEITTPISLQHVASDQYTDVKPARLVGLGEVPLYRRERLEIGQWLLGPALVTERVSTSYIAPGWCAVVDPTGILLLEHLQ